MITNKLTKRLGHTSEACFDTIFTGFLFKCRALACYVKIFPEFVPRLLSLFPLRGHGTRRRDYGQTQTRRYTDNLADAGGGVSVVNSWNEWDPLREVIVGSARGAVDMGYEPALSPYFGAGCTPGMSGGQAVHPSLVDEAERQLDHFSELLNRLGIVVRRPDPVEHSVAFKTPDWETSFGHATACPRDVLLVIGDEIIEAPMAQRARFFEYRAYRGLIKEYFAQGARWTAAPNPPARRSPSLLPMRNRGKRQE